MNARAPPGPAKTMSRGSSPTRSVRTTLGTPGVERAMTLMLADRGFTTQTSVVPRAGQAGRGRPSWSALEGHERVRRGATRRREREATNREHDVEDATKEGGASHGRSPSKTRLDRPVFSISGLARVALPGASKNA